MRRGLWRWLATLAVVLGAVLAVAPSPARAATYSGTCGTVRWSLDTDTGELHFKPINGVEGTLESNTDSSSFFWSWHWYSSSVKSVTSEGTIHATGNLSHAFDRCYSLTNVDGLASWDTSNVTNMSNLFDICSKLANVDGLASWDTSRVTSMHDAFRGCSSLVDVSGLKSWDTSHVTDLESAFDSCSSLANVDGLASWDTSGVTSLYRTFIGCSSLTSVDDLASWDTSNVTNMSNTFYGCSSLANVDGLASWDTSNVTNLVRAFNNCSSLTNVDGLSGWDTSTVTNIYAMFYGCSSLTDVSMENWDTSKVTNTSSMFNSCPKLSVVTIGPKVTSNVIAELPTPPSTSPYTGKWIRTDGKGPYTTSELSDLSADDRTGTWVWEGTDLTPYVVSFDANGGSGSVVSLQVTPFDRSVTIPSGSSLAYLGYDFASWNTRADGTGTSYLPGTARAPLHNEATGKPAVGGETITLYAIWDVKPVDIRPDNGELDITLQQNQQARLSGLPLGSAYVVTEMNIPAGWTLAKQQATTGVISPIPTAAG